MSGRLVLSLLHRELLRLPQGTSSHGREATSYGSNHPSAKPTTSDETLAQQPRTPSPDRGESYNTADQAAGSERKVTFSYPPSILTQRLLICTDIFKRATSRTSSSTSSSSAFFELTPSGNTQQKPQEPDALSALERYLDDIDATLQLEREIIRTFHSKPDFQENAEGKDAG